VYYLCKYLFSKARLNNFVFKNATENNRTDSIDGYTITNVHKKKLTNPSVSRCTHQPEFYKAILLKA
jgi:hypothetical protein